MTETYRLIHLTKARGLYSKDNPDEPTQPLSSFTKKFVRPITGEEGPINDPNHPCSIGPCNKLWTMQQTMDHATNYNDLYYLFYCESKATMAFALVLIYSR